LQGEHLSFGRPRKATTAVSSLLVALALGAFAWLSPAAARASLTPIHGRSMWIWYLNRSDGGSVPAILSRARAAGVATLIIKSSDGGNYWSQFSSSLVRELRAGGLQVCAWQYVYGTDPVAEADMGARAARAGAQCLIIDAEAEYEGRYASAAAYLRELRRLVGRDYPVGLASFPYVDYHPAFPYSVFLGPGGAQFDMPQMYWVEIGRGVGTVFRHTYTDNRIYRRPIFPLGQTYGSPLTGEIGLFRGLAVRYGSPGISWWDYAWTSAESFWPRAQRPLHAGGGGAPRLSGPRARLQGGRRAVVAGASRPGVPRPAHHGSVRVADPRHPAGVPGASSSARDRERRRGDVASAPAAGSRLHALERVGVQRRAEGGGAPGGGFRTGVRVAARAPL